MPLTNKQVALTLVYNYFFSKPIKRKDDVIVSTLIVTVIFIDFK